MIMSTALWRPSVGKPRRHNILGNQVRGNVKPGQSLIRCAGARGSFPVSRIANGCKFRNWELRSWKFAAVVEGQEQAQTDQDREQEVERAKLDLLQAVMDTKRGAEVTSDQRAAIEEAMVGQVYQNFDCKGRTDGGTVENIVRWSVRGLLQENEGATLIVSAKFSVASPRSIILDFEEARVAEVEISAELESFIAPALLPRTFINLQILQFLRSLDLRFPLRGSQTQPQTATRAPIGAWYNLTFLDKNLLLGRALGTGGVFVFTRTQARRKSI